jgi:hypothetical protein
MSASLRKCISFGLAGTRRPSSGNPQSVDYQFQPGNYANLNLIADSGTRWAKVWVDLPSLWPTEAGLNTVLRDSLDRQLALLKTYGCAVVLTINHELPEWINGSTDRFRAPSNTDANGPWSRMFSALASRYSLSNPNRPFSGYSYADIIEFCNEPNQLWNPAPNDTVAGTVAVLFKRAKQISAALNGTPLVGGPATSDLGPEFLGETNNYWDFTVNVCRRLAGNGFYDVGTPAMTVWTAHNYTDVTYDQGADTIAPDRDLYQVGNPRFSRRTIRSRATFDLLQREGWRGWPEGNAGYPHIFLTEGGAQRQVVTKRWSISDAQFEDYQAFLVNRNLVRMTAADTGAGVDMMANYLLITDFANYDTGMIRDDGSLLPRSLYTNVWKPYPGRT